MSDDIKKLAELAGGQYPRGMYPNAIMFYPKELDRFVELIEKAQAARIETLEAALRGLDDMIVDLDAGHRELHEVSRFINGALEGWKR